MRTIEISETVWEAIAAQGKFGEIEDDVLRRILNLPMLKEESQAISNSKKRRTIATQCMSSGIDNNELHVSFAGGESRRWPLPKSSDKIGIGLVREEAVSFAQNNGATIGQQNAVKKALTDNGYYLTK